MFKGQSNFCIPKSKLIPIISSLQEMSVDLNGTIDIKDSDSDSI